MNGWFKTGDHGFLNDEGYVHLLGRKNEMINMGALEISPLEVEEKICEIYPDCELYVICVSDPAGIVGEIPALCYVGKEALTITPSDLSHALSAPVEGDFILRILYRVESLPKTESEKILRGELREKIIAGSIDEIENVY